MSTEKQHDAANKTSHASAWKGFVAGSFSGMMKLAVGHPFDTIKVRLQTSDKTTFAGPWDCLKKTVKKEGFRAVYKGASPPLVGWMFMDSLMLGSLTNYRRLLRDHVFAPKINGRPDPAFRLNAWQHGVAGVFAGWTVSLIASPFEHIKARLQIQYAADKHQRLYSGPIDCTRKILRNHGVPGLYQGLFSTIIFRTFFFAWWSTYDLYSTALRRYTDLPEVAVNFWAGGLSAQMFWIFSYPSDVVKQRIMTDGLGKDKKYPRWRDAAKSVYRDQGWKGYWRGFVPCFLRAFPANAMALLAFEAVMRMLNHV